MLRYKNIVNQEKRRKKKKFENFACNPIFTTMNCT